MSRASSRFANESRQFTNLPTYQLTNSPTYQFTHLLIYQFLHSLFDERHQIDKVRICLRACLRALQHDRTERTRGDDGLSPPIAELLEWDVADSRARLFLLVREQQAPAGTTAERVVSISYRLGDVS